MPSEKGIYLAIKYNSFHLPVILPVIWEARFPKALNALDLDHCYYTKRMQQNQ